MKKLCFVAVGVQEDIAHTLKAGGYLQGAFRFTCTHVTDTFFYHQSARVGTGMIDKDGDFFGVLGHFFQHFLCRLRVADFFFAFYS